MSMQESYSTTVDNLFASSQMMPVDADRLTIAAGENLKRGSLVTSDGELVSSATADVYAVLAEDVDATSAAKEAAVYLTGDYNENSIIVGGSIQVSDVKVSARKVGIFIKSAVSVDK